MTEIVLKTVVAALPELCFDAARDVELHVASTAHTGERAVAGRTSGLIEMGEQVTWRARHFGLWLHHTALITAYDRPNHFQDTMTSGAFKTFVHDHTFRAITDCHTEISDVLRFESPLGPLGRLVDELVLRRYLGRLVVRRNEMLREVVERRASMQSALQSHK